jgi:hypothetical protein
MNIRDIADDLGLEMSDLELKGAREAFFRMKRVELYGDSRLEAMQAGVRTVCEDPKTGYEMSSGYFGFLRAWKAQGKTSIFDYLERSSPWPQQV